MKKLWCLTFVLLTIVSQAQNKDERITRDIEIAENVLTTLIKQQSERRNFWISEVRGSYSEGFGVTLRVPFDNIPFAYTITTGALAPVTEDYIGVENGVAVARRYKEDAESEKDRERLKTTRAAQRDSARDANGDRLIEASKTFLADYGDLISLAPNEKILITTQTDRGRNYVFSINGNYKSPERKIITVEAVKSDLTQYKQGKMTRDQLMSKIKVLNSVVNNESYPDLELLSTIFNRLYRSDLSKSYFMSSTPTYERIKDFGATFYMQVYSSNEAKYQRWDMPTVQLEDLDQAARDKKVIELYPIFEKDLKENMVEYGRTLNSLKDEENVIFDVTMTRCKGCGIPSTLELSIKAGALKEYSSGKISKDAAIAKINVKKGPGQ